MTRERDYTSESIARCVASRIRSKLATRGSYCNASVDAFGNRYRISILLHNWTHGRSAPNLITLAKIADALGCDLPDLVPTRTEVLAEMRGAQ